MSKNIIPVFKSHYSYLRSILTLEAKKPEEYEKGPASIVEIAKKNKLEDICLVEDNVTSFPEAFKNLKDFNLRYGVRFTMCQNAEDKSPESLMTEHKVIVFAKSYEGINQLNKIYSEAHINNFYYIPRIDKNTLAKFWNENLLLVIPFYDSFLYNNLLTMNVCVPEFPTNPIFCREDNLLFNDHLIDAHLTDYIKKNKAEVIETQTIYYEYKRDFIHYLTARCIGKGSVLNKPELTGMSSDTFCFESYLEKKKRK